MARAQILIVEDDEDIQEIYREMLAGAFDADLCQKYNGKEGIDAVLAHKPDLILLDLLMPVMNGEEFLKNLRNGMNMQDVPVIICSVNQTLAQKLKDDKQANAVLPKLFSRKELIAVIANIVPTLTRTSE